MIRTDTFKPVSISLKGDATLFRSIANGSVVRVDIIGPGAGGGTFVRLAGKTVLATGISGYASGTSLDARVRLSGNTVYLHPLPTQGSSSFNLLTRLGVPNTETATFLVSFLQNIHARLDEKTINPLLRLAARFPDKEKRAAEAAAILSERGIDASFENVDRLISAIEGRTGNNPDTDEQHQKDRDFLAFINQKKGHDRHWVLFPFKRTYSGIVCSGSVRFLINNLTKKLIETRITFVENTHCWEFSLEGERCYFTADPPFKSVILDRFVVYLKEVLKKADISDILYYSPGTNPSSLIEPVDLEI